MVYISKWKILYVCIVHIYRITFQIEKINITEPSLLPITGLQSWQQWKVFGHKLIPGELACTQTHTHTSGHDKYSPNGMAGSSQY